jgi:predicted alpha/beta hydrolase family esterase
MTDLILPGLHGSGPDHWQRWWLNTSREARLVEQDDWENPRLADWLERLAAAVAAIPDATLIAHSLACALVARFAAGTSRLAIRGALLVAPADVDAPTLPPEARDFAPMALQRLPFPSLVVASSNDPYVTMSRARLFAARWGAEFIDIGAKGHISTDDGFGPWPEGLRLAERLTEHART